jgi:hypothetical protein
MTGASLIANPRATPSRTPLRRGFRQTNGSTISSGMLQNMGWICSSSGAVLLNSLAVWSQPNRRYSVTASASRVMAMVQMMDHAAPLEAHADRSAVVAGGIPGTAQFDHEVQNCLVVAVAANGHLNLRQSRGGRRKSVETVTIMTSGRPSGSQMQAAAPAFPWVQVGRCHRFPHAVTGSASIGPTATAPESPSTSGIRDRCDLGNMYCAIEPAPSHQVVTARSR